MAGTLEAERDNPLIYSHFREDFSQGHIVAAWSPWTHTRTNLNRNQAPIYRLRMVVPKVIQLRSQDSKIPQNTNRHARLAPLFLFLGGVFPVLPICSARTF
jgi:hypothetical protein